MRAAVIVGHGGREVVHAVRTEAARVGAVARPHPVVAVATIERVGRTAADQDVVVGATAQAILPAVTEQAVHVRDSKDVTRPAFAVGREGWGQFVRFASER